MALPVLFAPREMVRASAPDDMVLVPAGEFTMGTSIEEGGFPDEATDAPGLPGAVWIDRYEVSNAAYALIRSGNRLPSASQCRPAPHPLGTQPPLPASSNIRSSM